jgi:homoserine dehydrogenase
LNKPPLSIAVCGLGTVGRGVLEVLKRNADIIEQRAGRPIRVVTVASRTARPEVDLLGARFTTDLNSVIDDPDIDLVVELIGGETLADDLVRRSLAAGKHVVTANKAIIATHGDQYLEMAAARDLVFGFESAVAGGIPVIGALSRGLSANRINWVTGIINGTSNYILTAMAQSGQDFATALADAQALGYAEADPSFDVDGIDAAHKLTILACLAFGIGMRFEHLGIARQTHAGVELRVHPTLIPEQQLLASVDGVMNAVMINSDAAGDTLYYGAGAGGEPTASAVVADLIDVARGCAPRWWVPEAGPDDAVLIPVADIECACYLNIPSMDKPGVFARAATILSDHDISIEAVIQKEQAVHVDVEQSWVPIVILTHKVRERVMNEAIAELEALPEVVSPIKRIRVEHFV